MNTRVFAYGVICMALLLNCTILLAADLIVPAPKKPPELCSGRGVTPGMRQVQVNDASCPSGFRWKNTK